MERKPLFPLALCPCALGVCQGSVYLETCTNHLRNNSQTQTAVDHTLSRQSFVFILA